MPTERIKAVNVDVNGKKLSFGFYPVPDDENNPEELFCNTCPLHGFCNLIPDPRDPENKEVTFMDFCGATGDQSISETLSSDKYENLLPVVSDVIEYTKVLGSDVYQKIIEKDPYVKLSEVIDCMCGEGGYPCPMYNKEHSNCSSSNLVCVLKNLFRV